MKGDMIPESDHVSRYCSAKHIAQGGRISGTAFRLRESEDYLSVNWLEFLNLPDRASEIVEIKRVLATKMTLSPSARIAVLNVGEVLDHVLRCSPDSRMLQIQHEPLDEPPDPSHSGIFGLGWNDDLISDLIAEVVEQTYGARP